MEKENKELIEAIKDIAFYIKLIYSKLDSINESIRELRAFLESYAVKVEVSK